jgi:hypothetical protein
MRRYLWINHIVVIKIVTPATRKNTNRTKTRLRLEASAGSFSRLILNQVNITVAAANKIKII